MQRKTGIGCDGKWVSGVGKVGSGCKGKVGSGSKGKGGSGFKGEVGSGHEE